MFFRLCAKAVRALHPVAIDGTEEFFHRLVGKGDILGKRKRLPTLGTKHVHLMARPLNEQRHPAMLAAHRRLDLTGTGKRTPHSIPPKSLFRPRQRHEPDSSSGMAHPLPLLKNARTLSLKREHRERKRMEIRKPGAAELKPALALAWDVFPQGRGSPAFAPGHQNIQTLHRIRQHGGNAGQRDNDDVAAFSGLEPIGVIAARESHICRSSSPALIKGME